MTSKPHDALFKAAFEAPAHAGGVFRSILPPALREAIAWETLSREPGSFIDPELADRHSDLLFSVQLATDQGEGRVLLYLLLEHQSSNDRDMPLRMLIYLVRIWERVRKQESGPLPPVLPALISHAPEGWTAPVSFHELFEPSPRSVPALADFIPDFRLLVDDLAHVDNDELRLRALEAFPTVVLWALRDGRDGPKLLRNFGYWLATLREMVRTPHGVEAVAQVLRYVALVSGDMRFEEFRATISGTEPELEEVAMTIAEQLRQEGREEGRQEGRQEGHAEFLLKQLTLKFGEPPPAYLARLESASKAQLECYVERILTARTLEDVFAD